MNFPSKVVVGNRQLSIVVEWGTSDGLSLTLGTGAVGVGPDRGAPGHPPFIARHSIDLFNRGDAAVHTLFWDGRIAQTAEGLMTPAGLDPLPGLSGPLAAQALFPLLDRAEMRGADGDLDVNGGANELAALDDGDPQAIWSAILARLLAIPGYVTLFEAAFPTVTTQDLTMAHAANAIGAFEAEAFSFTNTPWDRYLRGELDAIGDDAKLGARLFFGNTGCGNCHSGALLSDQQFHATGIVQLGPGKAGTEPFDHGREHATGDPADRWAFRTPPLRNTALSGPWMHDGALLSIEAVLVHYALPQNSAATYDPQELHPDLQGTVQQDAAHIEELVDAFSEVLPTPTDGSGTVGLSNLRAFLNALTDPAAEDMSSLRPATVPSGLPVP